MMNEPKIISFPKGRRARPQSSDEKLVHDIRKAWRKLARTIRAAQDAGLKVETGFWERNEPKITRQL
jgi:hypothetical protein